MKVFDNCEKCNEEHILVDGICKDCVRLYNIKLITKMGVARNKLKNALVDTHLAEGYLEEYTPYMQRVKNIRLKLQCVLKLMDSTIRHQDKVKKER